MKKRVDSLGRISIPKYIREDMKLEENTFLSIEYDSKGKQITLKKEDDSCAVCGKTDEIFTIDQSLFICKACLEKLKEKSL